MTATSATQPVLSYSARASLRRQREPGDDGTVRLVILPMTWRDEIKLHALIGVVLAGVICAFLVADARSGSAASVRPTLTAMIRVAAGTFAVWVPINLLTCSVLLRRVITVTVATDRVAVRWKHLLRTIERSWPHDVIARVDVKPLWGRVTARGRDGTPLFSVSPPDTEDVLWLAQHLRRELGLDVSPS